MTLTPHPSPAPCSTGSWSQKWDCGWHQPATTASHAGYTFGHNILPLLLIAAFVIAVAVSRKRRRNADAVRRNLNASGTTRARRRARSWGDAR
jgi:hypothetical protein